MPQRWHQVEDTPPAHQTRRGGTASLVLKAFLIVGTIGFFAWPEPGSEAPTGAAVLLIALVAAAVALLVLRLLRRTRPLLLPYLTRGLRRLRGEGSVLDATENVLSVVAVLGWLLVVVGLVVVGVMAALGHKGVPEAVVIVPLCVSVGAQIVLWAMGRGEFPGGEGGA